MMFHVISTAFQVSPMFTFAAVTSFHVSAILTLIAAIDFQASPILTEVVVGGGGSAAS